MAWVQFQACELRISRDQVWASIFIKIYRDDSDTQPNLRTTDYIFYLKKYFVLRINCCILFVTKLTFWGGKKTTVHQNPKVVGRMYIINGTSHVDILSYPVPQIWCFSCYFEGVLQAPLLRYRILWNCSVGNR